MCMLMEDLYVSPGSGSLTPTYVPAEVTVQFAKDPFDEDLRTNAQSRMWKVQSSMLLDVSEHLIRTDNRVIWLFGSDHASGSNQWLSPRAVIKAPPKSSTFPGTFFGLPYMDIRLMDSLVVTAKGKEQNLQHHLYVAGFCLPPDSCDSWAVGIYDLTS